MKGTAWWAALTLFKAIALLSQNGVLLIFAFTLALASAASALWARYCLSQVSYRRHLADERIAFGAETTLELEFVNAKPLPLAWLLVRDEFPARLELLPSNLQALGSRRRARLISLVSLRWYERVMRTHRVRATHRGRFLFGPAELVSGDAFGFERRVRAVDDQDVLIVYPKIVPVKALGLPAGRPMGEWFAQRRIIEDPLRFASVREYLPGDNPRFVHWKATARTNTLQTKVFEPTNTLTLVLMVDVQTAAKPYEYVPEYLEYLCCAAGSLALYGLEQRHMVGLCANSITVHGDRWTYVRPARHPEQAAQILTVLACTDSFTGVPFERVLRSLAIRLPLGATVLALTARPRTAVYGALISLQMSAHPVLLYTINDEPPNVPDRIPSYHLGGRDAWRHLEKLELA